MTNQYYRILIIQTNKENKVYKNKNANLINFWFNILIMNNFFNI